MVCLCVFVHGKKISLRDQNKVTDRTSAKEKDESLSNWTSKINHQSIQV